MERTGGEASGGGERRGFGHLSEPQAAAAGHVEGPLLIFAGAGSGKTRVITVRVANLILNHGVPPWRLLAVTFTNKAAGEMRRRLDELVGPEIAKGLWIGTFHAVCARLLRIHHAAVGLERNFVIYDEADQRALMTRVIKDLGLDDRRFPVRQVLGRVHREKQEARGPADFEVNGPFDGPIQKAYALYDQRLREANAVDFEDLLLHVLRLAENPEGDAGKDLRSRFMHVLVDEFQDTNLVQYRLVRALASSQENLCVVGDDDQSIYRWRGADVRNIRGFRKDFPRAKVVKLEQNYRSTGAIVRAALGVIKPSREREPKELFTEREVGSPVRVVLALNEHDEAAYVAAAIRELEERGADRSQIAVFYRVHAQSRVLEEVLRSERIPYQIFGGIRFFDRAEVKDLLAYLRAIDNPRSDVDLARIINVPARKIGDGTIDKLYELAGARGFCLDQAVSAFAAGEGGGASAARKSVAAFAELMGSLRAASRALRPSELAEAVLEKSGYKRLLEADESAEAEARLQNLEELVGSIAEYEEEVLAAGETPILSGYLERVTLAGEGDAAENVPRVAMMTVHAAKGLEFDAVFLTGMEEELFPFKSMEARRDDDVEEERRLAYVAITRARQELTVLHAARRTIFGNLRFGVPSRFIADVPREVVKAEATPAATFDSSARQASRALGASGGTRSGYRPEPGGRWVHPLDREEHEAGDWRAATAAGRAGARPAAPAVSAGERYIERDDAAPPPSLQPRRPNFPAASPAGAPRGARGAGGRDGGRPVSHPTFGVGRVHHVDSGDDPTATVEFPGYGLKRIKLRYLQEIG